MPRVANHLLLMGWLKLHIGYHFGNLRHLLSLESSVALVNQVNELLGGLLSELCRGEVTGQTRPAIIY